MMSPSRASAGSEEWSSRCLQPCSRQQPHLRSSCEDEFGNRSDNEVGVVGRGGISDDAKLEEIEIEMEFLVVLTASAKTGVHNGGPPDKGSPVLVRT